MSAPRPTVGTVADSRPSEDAPQPPKLLPPHYFIGSVLATALIGILTSPRLLPMPWPLVGLVPMAVGFWLTLRGSRQFAERGTNIIPLSHSTALVTDGVFRISRNPMYLGMLLFLAGAACLANVAWAWLVPASFFGLIRQAFVVREEALMKTTFGADYEAYCGRVRRWL